MQLMNNSFSCQQRGRRATAVPIQSMDWWGPRNISHVPACAYGSKLVVIGERTNGTGTKVQAADPHGGGGGDP